MQRTAMVRRSKIPFVRKLCAEMDRYSNLPGWVRDKVEDALIDTGLRYRNHRGRVDSVGILRSITRYRKDIPMRRMDFRQ